jgi:hypothetical protein
VRPHALAAGLAAALLYIVVAVATMTLSDQPVRPLYDGAGDAAPYRWVNPPRQFAASNVPPNPRHAEMPIRSTGTSAGSVWTDDLQVTVFFPEGAFAGAKDQTAVAVDITPVDAATLAPLPSRLVADGNAYRVELAFVPSAERLTELPVRGEIKMTAPHVARSVLYSPDGRSWQPLPTQKGVPAGHVAPFTRPGVYVAGAVHLVGTGGGPTVSGPVGAAVVTALLCGSLFALALVRRRRDAHPTPD